MNICSKLVIHTTDKKQNLVFNGYTGSLDIVTSQIATFLKKRNIDDPNLGKSDRSSLEEAKYILMDEDALADAIFKQYIDYTSTALEDSDTYVICPTLNCNLFCSYCYEKGKCRRNHHLDENSLNAIFDFMTQRSVHNNRAGHISFFGGEPLLPENTEINKKILQYARKHGFSCDITTNGTTIKDVHVATLLRENHDLIKSIQISIDGTKEYHDNMKFTVDGCGTFDLVMENILSLLRMGILVFVRINISRNNINEIEELTDYFMNSQLCYFDNFDFYFAPITNSDNVNDPNTLDEADLAIELERLNVLDKCQLPLLGYLVGAIAEPEKIRLPAFRRCDANRENYYVFSPDSYVYPCMELLGQCQYAMFQYFPTFGIVCGNEPYVYSNILHAENRVECKDCSIALLCGGGCISAKSNCTDYCTKQHQVVEKYLWHLREIFNLE